jgi:NADH:ubiquinone reductase (H+-translocating)
MAQIVVLGGGFGGIYTVKFLLQSLPKKNKIILINKNNYFLFSPMLHEVATGGINRQHIVQPIRELFTAGNFGFIKAEVTKIDAISRLIYYNDHRLSYDKLVIALGSTTNFFNVPGADEHAMPLKTLTDSVIIRSRIIDSVEQASKLESADGIMMHLTFVIVGGGPTGVELAGEVVEFVSQILSAKSYGNLQHYQQSVILLQKGPEIMPFIGRRCRLSAMNELRKKGVNIMLDSCVRAVKHNAVILEGGRIIRANTIIWTAGINPARIETMPLLQDINGYFQVNHFLQVKNTEDVYALGDCALFADKPLPALAQVAVKQAKAIAHNIKNELEGKLLMPFMYNSSGLLVSVGQKFAVAEIRGIAFKGFFAWWLWRTVYLFKLIGLANKFKVAYEWTLALFFKRDTTQI